MAVRQKYYGCMHLALDVVLVFATGGLWLVYLLVRFLRS